MHQETAGGPEIWIRGPVGAAAARADASAPPQQPIADNSFPASATLSETSSVSWMNAHGGAGATTLATVFGGFDAGSRWPDPAGGASGRILLVARTHASGLQAVSQVLDMIRKNEQPSGSVLQAVVLVADAPGRLPQELAKRIKVIGSVVKIHRIPWIPAWRMGDLSGPAPRESSGLARLINSP
ncbi:DUF6668 family protein [Streptomyces sp. NPDC087917]|uniref:DUF6668 family protein n=1 Tax=Streptomyces sp. NPDC087917 TaxID=3155060 RepID=UPI0034189272